MRIVILLLYASILAACTSNPAFDSSQTASSLTPSQAVASATGLQGQLVLWGGTIITSTNLKNETRIEILAYPLDSDHYPQTDQPAYGRFLLLKDGYLETVDYAPGRLVTVSGIFEGTRKGKLDESEYTYPVVRAEKLHLWSKDGKSQTRFHFGIGVMFRN